ncbi:hypothetical protein AWB68_01792 [Caballeronia choica]|uniref:Uncharacterized protein n=1 Tax=Caballeronia choica TaxID=326476 RepID=A0A158HAC1_9BURK|nr:hypothetical protein [Caballeronia choica]SAL40943.1 hypothetical protein AWB68_01792 [Caballeronia choica]
MQQAKYLAFVALCALAALSTAARAETYHFAEGASSMPGQHSGAHSSHAPAKHKSHTSKHRAGQAGKTLDSHQ